MTLRHTSFTSALLANPGERQLTSRSPTLRGGYMGPVGVDPLCVSGNPQHTEYLEHSDEDLDLSLGAPGSTARVRPLAPV
jgi:hypothetical protein